MIKPKRENFKENELQSGNAKTITKAHGTTRRKEPISIL